MAAKGMSWGFSDKTLAASSQAESTARVSNAWTPSFRSLFVPLEFERIPSGLAQPEAEFVDFFLQLNHAHFAPNGGAIETGQLLGVRAKLRVTVDQGFLVFFALAD